MKHMFENYCSLAVSLTEQCTSSELFCTESSSRGRYETCVQTHKFPLFYERIIVQTAYNFYHYRGRQDVHISVSSTRGNEKFMNKESLGEKLVDGYRKIAAMDLNAYYVEPLEAGGI